MGCRHRGEVKKRGETEGEEGSRAGCSGIDGVKIVTAFHPSRRGYYVVVNVSGTRLSPEMLRS